jgi:hypothetical protein
MIGYYLYARGSKSFCMRLGKELERTQGITSWKVSRLNPKKGIWGLFI